MTIGNITQTISELPPAGSRGVDVQSIFVIKQEDFQDHLQGTTVTELNTLKDQLNTRIGEINSTATTMNGYADTASAGASTATTKAGEASTSATAAVTSSNQASTFATNSSNSATKSRQWADNNYNVAVEAGRYSAKHWATVAENATTNKVDKVTSTDNAIVRFDGTTGAVQNSSVIINDAGNVGVGQPTPISKFHVHGNIRTACSSGDAVNTRGIIFGIDGNVHGRLAVDNTNNLLFFGSGGLGYGTGSGGVVTQLTNKSTTVTLNKPSGLIIMNSEALAAGVSVIFTLKSTAFNTNAEDVLIITPRFASVFPANYDVRVVWCGASVECGLFVIKVTNISEVSRSEALELNFAVIKGANS